MTTKEALETLRNMKNNCEICRLDNWRDALAAAIEALELIEYMEDDAK